MTRDEANETLLSFYDKKQIFNSTVELMENQSFYQWVAEFTGDEANAAIIEATWESMEEKIEGQAANETETASLDADGLLGEAWTPVTVDIHYDLHHYRIFVAREAGEKDRELFKGIMEIQKASFLKRDMANCTEISLDALIVNEIPEWWDANRVWVVSLSVCLVMTVWIVWGRMSHNKVVKRHKAQMKGNTRMMKGG